MSWLAARPMRRRRLKRSANPRRHLGRDVGCGALVGAEIGQVAANPVECRQYARGSRIGANALAQRCRGGVIEQSGLQVGQQLGCDRFGFVARVVAHRCPRRLYHALTQASLHHGRLDGATAILVPRITS
jgi:hypothetical protein